MWIFAYNFKQLMDPEGPVESRLETQIAPQKLKTQSDVRNWPWNQKGRRRANARSSRGQASRIQNTGLCSLWLGLGLPLAVVWGWVNLILKVHELKGKPPLLLLPPWSSRGAHDPCLVIAILREPWTHCSGFTKPVAGLDDRGWVLRKLNSADRSES